MSWACGSISLSVSPLGAGAARAGFSAGGGMIYGEIVNVKPGYRFVKWTFSCQGLPDADDELFSESITIPNEQTDDSTYPGTLTAVFETVQTDDDPSLYATIIAYGENHGSLSGSGVYEIGRQYTITATPETHYRLTKIECSDGNTYLTSPVVATASSDLTYVAYFEELPQYEVKARNAPYSVMSAFIDAVINCTVDGFGQYYEGDECTITITPDVGSEIVAFFDNDGHDYGQSSTATFTVTKDVEFEIACLYRRCRIVPVIYAYIPNFKEWGVHPAAGSVTGQGVGELHYGGDAFDATLTPNVGFMAGDEFGRYVSNGNFATYGMPIDEFQSENHTNPAHIVVKDYCRFGGVQGSRYLFSGRDFSGYFERAEMGFLCYFRPEQRYGVRLTPNFTPASLITVNGLDYENGTFKRMNILETDDCSFTVSLNGQARGWTLVAIYNDNGSIVWRRDGAVSRSATVTVSASDCSSVPSSRGFVELSVSIENYLNGRILHGKTTGRILCGANGSPIYLG